MSKNRNKIKILFVNRCMKKKPKEKQEDTLKKALGEIAEQIASAKAYREIREQVKQNSESVTQSK